MHSWDLRLSLASMQGGADSQNTERPLGAKRGGWSRRRQALLGGSTAAILVAVALVVVPALTGSWSPVIHSTCQAGSTVATNLAWVPLVMVNAPYGGYVAGNASLQPGAIVGGRGLGTSNGLPASNGSVGGFFVHLWLNLSGLSNATIWGAGKNDPCTSAWTVSAAVDVTGSQVYSGILGNQGDVSDSAEPHEYNLTAPPGGSTSYLSNGFVQENSRNISTCGGATQWVAVTAPKLTVWIPFSVGGESTIVPYTLPSEQVFRYWFPADYGIWQVDNLSAPGGPGGGWAFSYSPCD